MVVLSSVNALAEAEQIYWSDVKREVIVMPRDRIGSNLAAMLTAKRTSQDLQPNLITQVTSHYTIINMVNVGRFITIVTEAMQSAYCHDLVFKDLHGSGGQSYLAFFAFWREDNETLCSNTSSSC